MDGGGWLVVGGVEIIVDALARSFFRILKCHRH